MTTITKPFTLVKFLTRTYHGTNAYNRGDTAGFTEREAERLIADGVAVPANADTDVVSRAIADAEAQRPIVDHVLVVFLRPTTLPTPNPATLGLRYALGERAGVDPTMAAILVTRGDALIADSDEGAAYIGQIEAFQSQATALSEAHAAINHPTAADTRRLQIAFDALAAEATAVFGPDQRVVYRHHTQR